MGTLDGCYTVPHTHHRDVQVMSHDSWGRRETWFIALSIFDIRSGVNDFNQKGSNRFLLFCAMHVIMSLYLWRLQGDSGQTSIGLVLVITFFFSSINLFLTFHGRSGKMRPSTPLLPIFFSALLKTLDQTNFSAFFCATHVISSIVNTLYHMTFERWQHQTGTRNEFLWDSKLLMGDTIKKKKQLKNRIHEYNAPSSWSRREVEQLKSLFLGLRPQSQG